MQPVGRSVSVCWPTLMPSTAVIVWFARLRGQARRRAGQAHTSGGDGGRGGEKRPAVESGAHVAISVSSASSAVHVVTGPQNVGGVLIHNSTASCFDGLNQRCPSVLSNQKLSPSFRT